MSPNLTDPRLKRLRNQNKVVPNILCGYASDFGVADMDLTSSANT
jgi:hypothetical protein